MFAWLLEKAALAFVLLYKFLELLLLPFVMFFQGLSEQDPGRMLGALMLLFAEVLVLMIPIKFVTWLVEMISLLRQPPRVVEDPRVRRTGPVQTGRDVYPRRLPPQR